jgi:hypothetical protein
MRRAAQTVQEHAIGVAIEDIDRAVEALEAPYADRILRLFRTAMAIEDPRERATRILELVDELGLEPPPPTRAVTGDQPRGCASRMLDGTYPTIAATRLTRPRRAGRANDLGATVATARVERVCHRSAC